MIAAGCEAWAGAEELAVMGLTEVLAHLPRLLRLRASLTLAFLASRALTCSSASMRRSSTSGSRSACSARGLTTVQYVSPQVWAWRQGRVRTIGRACDLVLCLLPFETGLLRDATACAAASSATRWPIRSRWSSIGPRRARRSA